MKEEKDTKTVPYKWYSKVKLLYDSEENVGEKHIYAKYCKCSSIRVTTDLFNSENLKVAIAQLCHELQVCNFTIL